MNKTRKTSILNRLGYGKKEKGEVVDEQGRPQKFLHSTKDLTDGTIIYSARFLGSMEIPQSKGVELVKEVIKKLKVAWEVKKADVGTKESKLPKVDIIISIGYVKVVQQKTKQVIANSPLQRVSYCADDHSDRKVFAYVAKNDASKKHNCFVFLCEREAFELTLTLGQAFQMAYQKYLEKNADKKMETQEKDISALNEKIESMRLENEQLRQQLSHGAQKEESDAGSQISDGSDPIFFERDTFFVSGGANEEDKMQSTSNPFQDNNSGVASTDAFFDALVNTEISPRTNTDLFASSDPFGQDFGGWTPQNDPSYMATNGMDPFTDLADQRTGGSAGNSLNNSTTSGQFRMFQPVEVMNSPHNSLQSSANAQQFDLMSNVNSNNPFELPADPFRSPPAQLDPFSDAFGTTSFPSSTTSFPSSSAPIAIGSSSECSVDMFDSYLKNVVAERDVNQAANQDNVDVSEDILGNSFKNFKTSAAISSEIEPLARPRTETSPISPPTTIEATTPLPRTASDGNVMTPKPNAPLERARTRSKISVTHDFTGLATASKSLENIVDSGKTESVTATPEAFQYKPHEQRVEETVEEDNTEYFKMYSEFDGSSNRRKFKAL